MNERVIIDQLGAALPNLLALYAFGSQVQGTADAQSDLDLAVLVEGKLEPLTLWRLAGDLAERVGCEVDLLDLRASSTVMQYQIITTGKRLWAKDSRADLYESFVLSEMTELNTARAALLEDIRREGHIYDR